MAGDTPGRRDVPDRSRDGRWVIAPAPGVAVADNPVRGNLGQEIGRRQLSRLVPLGDRLLRICKQRQRLTPTGGEFVQRGGRNLERRIEQDQPVDRIGTRAHDLIGHARQGCGRRVPHEAPTNCPSSRARRPREFRRATAARTRAPMTAKVEREHTPVGEVVPSNPAVDPARARRSVEETTAAAVGSPTPAAARITRWRRGSRCSAPRPATGPALAFFQLLQRPANPTLPSPSAAWHPRRADELVARQRRDVLPRSERRGVGDQRLAQVRGSSAHYPTGHSLAAHEATVARQRVARAEECRVPP